MNTRSKILKKSDVHRHSLAQRQRDPFDHLPEEAREIQKARQELGTRIKAVDNRLTFGYSEPLYRYKMSLYREDMQLLYRMTDILTQ